MPDMSDSEPIISPESEPLTRVFRRDSIYFRLIAIGIVFLLLFIPLMWVQGVQDERASFRSQAEATITESWGRQQTVAGPVLLIPYDYPRTVPYRDVQGVAHTQIITEHDWLYVFPVVSTVHIEKIPEIRRLGLFEVPVYRAALEGTATFPAQPDVSILPKDATIKWDEASILIGLSDLARLQGDFSGAWLGTSHFFDRWQVDARGEQGLQTVASSITLTPGQSTEVEYAFSFRGSGSLGVLALGDTQTLTVESSWPHPRFSGKTLPGSREITSEGFQARWETSRFARTAPSVGIIKSFEEPDVWSHLQDGGIGVALVNPVDPYRLSERATKYAILIIALIFTVFLVVEITLGRACRLYHYGLSGLALTLFFLTLTALAEQTGFLLAYILAAALATSVLVWFMWQALEEMKVRAAFAGLLMLTYCFLYLTVSLEDLALLTGSLALWVALIAIMGAVKRFAQSKSISSEDA